MLAACCLLRGREQQSFKSGLILFPLLLPRRRMLQRNGAFRIECLGDCLRSVPAKPVLWVQSQMRNALALADCLPDARQRSPAAPKPSFAIWLSQSHRSVLGAPSIPKMVNFLMQEKCWCWPSFTPTWGSSRFAAQQQPQSGHRHGPCLQPPEMHRTATWSPCVWLSGCHIIIELLQASATPDRILNSDQPTRHADARHIISDSVRTWVDFAAAAHIALNRPTPTANPQYSSTAATLYL